jgi:FkbH-like protein
MHPMSALALPKLATLVELLRSAADENPTRTAYTFLSDGSAGQTALSTKEVYDRARAIGAWLQYEGFSGGRVLLVYPPGLDYICAFWGCLCAGAVAVPAPAPSLKRDNSRIQAIVQNSGAAAALTANSVLGRLHAICSQNDWALRLVATDDMPDNSGSYHDRVPPQSELAYLQYTSGSTSAPKGVMVSHANVLHNLAYIDEGFKHDENSTIVSWLPHIHDMGLVYGILQPIYSRVPAYLMSPSTFIRRPMSWLETISSVGATHSGAPNFAYDLCVNRSTAEQRRQLNLRKWRVAFNGSEMVRAETLQRFAETFQEAGFERTAFCPAYGLAEATLKVCCGAPNEAAREIPMPCESAPEAPARPRSLVGCGLPTGDTRIAIVDWKTLQECPPGQVGEIWVSGPGVAMGYWNRPEENREVFGASLPSQSSRRFLRSGDLGLVHEGQLFIAGRLKDLIIVHGQNYYPEDIELIAAQSHPALRNSPGAAFAAPDETIVVVQEVRPAADVDFEPLIGRIRAAVSEQLGIQIYAVVLVAAGAIPRTSSGKVRRGDSRAMYLNNGFDVLSASIVAGAVNANGRPPADRDESLKGTSFSSFENLHANLKASIRSLLGSGQDIDEDASLVALGLDSVRAAQLQAHVENDLKSTVDAAYLLGGATLNRLAAYIWSHLERNTTVQNPTPKYIPSSPRSTATQPSLEQERLWLLEQIGAPEGLYNLTAAIRIDGPLATENFVRSFNEIVQRHEILRTSFEQVCGKPMQVIAASLQVCVPIVDVAHLESEVERAVSNVGGEQSRVPFRLRHPPLLRAWLLRFSGRLHVLLVTAHHAIIDAESFGVLARELSALYSASTTGRIAPLPDLQVQYGDFAAWQREIFSQPGWDNRLSGWRRRLRRLSPETRDAESFSLQQGTAARHIAIDIPGNVRARLYDCCRSEGVTPFMMLLAAFAVFVHKRLEKDDIVLGIPVSGRYLPETQAMIGLFAYPTIVPMHLTPELTLREILQGARDAMLDVYTRKDIPFSKLLEVMRSEGLSNGAAAFDAMFGFLEDPIGEIVKDGVQLRGMQLPLGTRDQELFMTVAAYRDRLQGSIFYKPSRFDPEYATQMAGSYVAVLTALLDQPEQKLSAIGVFSGESREQMDPAGEGPAIEVVIAGSFTTEPLVEVLRYWSLQTGISLAVRCAPYNQLFQQLLDPASSLSQNRRGMNVIVLRLEDWLLSGASKLAASDSSLKEAWRKARDFVQAVRAMRMPKSGLLICICRCSPAMHIDPVCGPYCREAEAYIATELRDTAGISVVRSEAIDEQYPVADYYDHYSHALAHLPFTPQYFAAFGTSIARNIFANRTIPYKVIAVDCDETLWSGVCGEDSPSGIEICHRRKALQSFLALQQANGMLLCLCSRNDEGDVLAVFEQRSDMVLQLQHIVARRINWRPKSENLRSLARELNLGLESFIFVDDDPFECSEVRANCPEVLTLQLPRNAAKASKYLNHIWAFDRPRITGEDRARASFYRQNASRAQAIDRMSTLRDFLDSLELTVTIAPMEDERHVGRVSQLSHRTNQFTFSAAKHLESELSTFLKDKSRRCFIVHAKDRFGDYGLIGAMLCQLKPGSFEVQDFYLSCRALAKGIEHQMLASAGRAAEGLGLPIVEVRLVTTPRNGPALAFLQAAAGQFGRQDRGDWSFSIPASDCANPVFVPENTSHDSTHENPSTNAESAASERSSTNGSRMSADVLVRIATDLTDTESITAAVRGAANIREDTPVETSPPGDETEELIRRIYAELLGLDHVDLHEGFFHLGGDSLQAMRILSTVREQLGVELPMGVLFKGSLSVAELAKAVSEFKAAATVEGSAAFHQV